MDCHDISRATVVSQDRAEKLGSILIEAGVPAISVLAVGMGQQQLSGTDKEYAIRAMKLGYLL